VGDVAIDASADTTIDATKARQAASHLDWLREQVPGTAGATIQSVLVTPTRKAKQGAVPSVERCEHGGANAPAGFFCPTLWPVPPLSYATASSGAALAGVRVGVCTV
jgi:hypothetical protein